MTAAVAVAPVAGRRDLAAFIGLPWRIYADDPVWVPPLRREVRAVLDRAHPFHDHAEIQPFLARRAGVVVGRIVAIVNHAHNQYCHDRTGFIGLFECIEDDIVAAGLFAAAEQWLRQRGCTMVRGPMNLSTNDELCSPGVLIDGFADPPLVLMGHSPPYYAALFAAAGYDKSRDLFAYWMEGDPDPRLVRASERLARSARARIRSIDMRRFHEDVAAIQDIYNASWERNWGFVPFTAREIEHLARTLRPVIDPRLCLLAEVDGEPVGFLLALPDLHQALRHANGRLFPLGFLKFLWYRRTINATRVLTLGVKPAHRRRGLDVAMITRVHMEAEMQGKGQGECSWILEDNVEMRAILERIRARPYKTYRVFEKPLSA